MSSTAVTHMAGAAAAGGDQAVPAPHAILSTAGPGGWLARIGAATAWLSLRVLCTAMLLLAWLLLGLLISTAPEHAVIASRIAAELGGMQVMAAAGLGCLWAAWMLRAWLLRIARRRRDAEATRIAERLLADPTAKHAPFFLYLRAFETTGRLQVPLYLRLMRLGPAAGQLVTNDAESYVTHAIRRIAPMIALGRPGEADGAGRIPTDERGWKSEILLLMQHCKAILLVPSDRPGTLWEIATLQRDGLLGKCVFVMPPRSRKKQFDTRGRWQAARAALAAMAIELPDYQDGGMWFRLAADGRVSEVEPLLLGSVRQTRKSLKRLLDDAPPAGGLYAGVARADRRRRRATAMGWAGVVRLWGPVAIAAVTFSTTTRPVSASQEPWWLTMDRAQALKKQSEYEIGEPLGLLLSARYRSWAAATPDESEEQAKGALTVRGFFRLPDDKLVRLYGAYAQMLDRIDHTTCAALAQGTLDGAGFANALSYMPPQRVSEFLGLRTEAFLAEIEERPLPAVDKQRIAAAAEALRATLTPDERTHWQRFLTDQPDPDGDPCWNLRTLYGGVTRLGSAHGAAWARWIAALPLAAESTQ